MLLQPSPDDPGISSGAVRPFSRLLPSRPGSLVTGMTRQLPALFELLLSAYGPRHWWPAETPFEVCVGAILTQNTNWVNVEKAIANLKGAGLLDVDALVGIDPLELGEVIRPAGFFNVKSRRLKGFVTWLLLRAEGSLERLFAVDWRLLRRELLDVNGVGPETADSILLY